VKLDPDYVHLFDFCFEAECPCGYAIHFENVTKGVDGIFNGRGKKKRKTSKRGKKSNTSEKYDDLSTPFFQTSHVDNHSQFTLPTNEVESIKTHPKYKYTVTTTDPIFGPGTYLQTPGGVYVRRQADTISFGGSTLPPGPLGQWMAYTIDQELDSIVSVPGIPSFTSTGTMTLKVEDNSSKAEWVRWPRSVPTQAKTTAPTQRVHRLHVWRH